MILLLVLMIVWLVGCVFTTRFLKSGPAIVGSWSWQSWIIVCLWPIFISLFFLVWLVLKIRDVFLD